LAQGVLTLPLIVVDVVQRPLIPAPPTFAENSGLPFAVTAMRGKVAKPPQVSLTCAERTVRPFLRFVSALTV
jgi:hypothetical protein